MNSPIRRLSAIAAALFFCLLVSSSWIQFAAAKKINDLPDNKRTLLASYNRERGSILVGGEAIARSVATDGELKWDRRYPMAQLYSHVTGYYSYVYGAGGGIEGAEDELLSGRSDKLFYRRVSDLLTGKDPVGASLELTINPAAQTAADRGLGTQRGAVVALDPKTGAILAMVSHPAYDPAELSSHDIGAVEKAWPRLLKDEGDPLINRSIAGDLYPPGSTFKLVTAAAALESGTYTQNSTVPGPATLQLPGVAAPLANHDRAPCGPNDKTTLIHALEISCNTAFASLGMQLGAEALREQAGKFGFGQTLTVPMRATASSVPANMNEPNTAQAAIGQYDVRTTPLQMAMVAAAIGNGGEVMKPYLVRRVLGSQLQTIDEATPERLSEAVSTSTARQLTTMMKDVVTSGTGTAAQIAGVDVAGKTGTAQHAKGAAPHAWFVSFAPAADPKVAVAVVVEDGGNAGSEASGGAVAGPIAKSVMEAVLNS
ncbi:peptidoglycan D,D-transpeptidase FtsI family protein [Nostocoides australiense]|uniref:Penicillin-binding protein A n=1 Tax=Nostocoides australiense Ben110 TaxID=1193182 RepID=W6JZ87_9MICO|nr:penicillin-binding transpeptidase domain-containing protein [Tetrasphaera australiensis]MCB1300724.1 penicillin-binding protein 2 [Tetrasphaera sp.]CCH74000.1 Penicillin-binding protein A [Tetrasphaera australiensis Ben110]HPF80846.1 penicillin-binding transpeptidase domain-containing protein [Tetrasphaera australiensis]HRW01722.1 penicillin-binding transpeptidase domain-containing protein [Tetrasphaera sp.]